MKTMSKLLIPVIALLFSSLGMQAQIEVPAPSPGATLTQTVGLTDITIEYSRPGVKGREIFAAEGLVPFNKMWRTGANAATKITFSDDVKIKGNELEGGSYAVLTTPNPDMWKIHFYPYESGRWSTYVEKDPALTVEVKPQKMEDHVETMRIDINDIRMNTANIDLEWAKTRVSIPIKVEVDEKVMADIEQVLSGPSSNDYYAAARYLHDSGNDLEKALMYIEKAISEDDPKFWQVRRKALILADMGKKEEAIAAARKSMELAEAAGNEEYIMLNKKSIGEWSM